MKDQRLSTKRVRDHRSKNPVWYAYQTLKHNAKRRNLEFSLSWEFFREFASSTQYIQFKGREAFALTIDRKRSDRGYTEDNVQIMLKYENSGKGNRDIALSWPKKMEIAI